MGTTKDVHEAVRAELKFNPLVEDTDISCREHGRGGGTVRHRTELSGRWAAGLARHVRPGIDPAKAGQTASRLATLAGPR